VAFHILLKMIDLRISYKTEDIEQFLVRHFFERQADLGAKKLNVNNYFAIVCIYVKSGV
jgi:hypothetical protein